jgi:hypothetical protein
MIFWGNKIIYAIYFQNYPLGVPTFYYKNIFFFNKLIFLIIIMKNLSIKKNIIVNFIVSWVGIVNDLLIVLPPLVHPYPPSKWYPSHLVVKQSGSYLPFTVHPDAPKSFDVRFSCNKTTMDQNFYWIIQIKTRYNLETTFSLRDRIS